MTGEVHSCPDCGQALDLTAANHERLLVCPACGGKMHGLTPFERLLEEGLGAAVWVASAEGAPGAACPWCSLPMHSSSAGPTGLTVCRLCQQVWVPASADGWMAEHAAPRVGGVGSPAPVPSQCSNCGAPSEPDDLGRCRFCRAQITAPAPILVALPGDDAYLPGLFRAL